jgi:polysaccharide export outer membrane protein
MAAVTAALWLCWTVVAPSMAQAATHALRISSGDLLDVAVFDTPELSGRSRVNEAGDVMLPVAGAVRVSGMTADEAAVAVETKLRTSDILKEPHVTVRITEFATQGVTVMGEVNKPGIYPLLGSRGLMDMISSAGGLTEKAGQMVSVTHRSDPASPETVSLNSTKGTPVRNVDIRPGDTVVVSRAGVAYVVGDVHHAGGFLMKSDGRLTALQAIAMAGGTTKTSARKVVHLIRKTESGREDRTLSLPKMIKGKEADLALQDGDILFVPSSKLKIWAYRGVDSAISLTNGLAISGRL